MCSQHIHRSCPYCIFLKITLYIRFLLDLAVHGTSFPVKFSLNFCKTNHDFNYQGQHMRHWYLNIWYIIMYSRCLSIYYGRRKMPHTLFSCICVLLNNTYNLCIAMPTPTPYTSTPLQTHTQHTYKHNKKITSHTT